MNNTENTYTVIDSKVKGYDKKLYRKKNADEFCYLTKKGFKNFSEVSENPPDVIGDVFIRHSKHRKSNKQADVTGTIILPYSNRSGKTGNEYPLRQFKKQWRRTIGYAELDNHQFVRLVKYDVRFLLIVLLILLALIPFFLKSGSDISPISINTGETITEEYEAPEETPICYYEPFEEVTTLSADNPEIFLKNVSSNAETYFVSYEIYINGNPLKDESGNNFSTGALPPDRQVNINLWNQLDAGNYQLEVKATDYDYSILTELNENKDKYSEKEYQSLLNEATMPVHHTLSTTLIISK